MLKNTNFAKNRLKTIDAEQSKRTNLPAKMKQTFWTVQPNHETQLHQIQQQENRDNSCNEDWLYLEDIRGENRTATLGNRDIKLAQRRKRSFEKQAVLEAKKLALSNSQTLSVTATISSSESDNDNADQTFYVCGTWDSAHIDVSPPNIGIGSDTSLSLYSTSNRKRYRATKKDAIISEACLVADKYALFSQGLTELAVVFHKSQGTA